MKAEELMIDDWVMYHNELLHKSYPTRVEDGEHIDYIASNANFEPIPLTPEILEKNGFVLKPDGWLWCEDKDNEEQDYIFIQFRKGCDGVRICELGFVNKVQARFRQINDVHELQHALRLFRIKKDIVL